jgi:hypothetical protein
MEMARGESNTQLIPSTERKWVSHVPRMLRPKYIKQCFYCHIEYWSWVDRVGKCCLTTAHQHQGRIQDFKLRGGAHLKKLRRAEGGAKIFGVFRVKNHDFTGIISFKEIKHQPNQEWILTRNVKVVQIQWWIDDIVREKHYLCLLTPWTPTPYTM